MHTKTKTDRGARNDRRMPEYVHDPYMVRQRNPEPSVCRDCGSVYSGGRWQWMRKAPSSARPALCHACQRIRDNYPAGIITFTGDYAMERQAELLTILRHCEKQENSTHPQHRIMSIENEPGAIVVKTSDIHLPHRIASAVQHAWHGELSIHYDKGGYLVRVAWHYENTDSKAKVG